MEEEQTMDIGQPTDVRHVAHVTYDRFNGFSGLPSEFDSEVSRKPPSASKTVFGVSTQSMQLTYDSRGNCVPVILLQIQSRLYAQGGLQAEGIFRITAENSEEEYAREQLNRGVIPEGTDVHCLAGLIKAWFRELPTGVLDPLSPEQVTQCETEEDLVKLVKLLPQPEASLLNWAINLMADVVQHERVNKMNSCNVALVFAPNMSQMADPLTALMYAVKVMNLIKSLIEKTLRDRRAATSHGKRHGSPYESCDEDEDDDSDEDEDDDKEIKYESDEEEEEDETAEEENEKVAVKENAKIDYSVTGNETPSKESSESETSVLKSPRIDGIRSDSPENIPENLHLKPPELPVPAKSNSNRVSSTAACPDG